MGQIQSSSQLFDGFATGTISGVDVSAMSQRFIALRGKRVRKGRALEFVREAAEAVRKNEIAAQAFRLAELAELEQWIGDAPGNDVDFNVLFDLVTTPLLETGGLELTVSAQGHVMQGDWKQAFRADTAIIVQLETAQATQVDYGAAVSILTRDTWITVFRFLEFSDIATVARACRLMYRHASFLLKRLQPPRLRLVSIDLGFPKIEELLHGASFMYQIDSDHVFIAGTRATPKIVSLKTGTLTHVEPFPHTHWGFFGFGIENHPSGNRGFAYFSSNLARIGMFQFDPVTRKWSCIMSTHEFNLQPTKGPLLLLGDYLFLPGLNATLLFHCSTRTFFKCPELSVSPFSSVSPRLELLSLDKEGQFGYRLADDGSFVEELRLVTISEIGDATNVILLPNGTQAFVYHRHPVAVMMMDRPKNLYNTKSLSLPQKNQLILFYDEVNSGFSSSQLVYNCIARRLTSIACSGYLPSLTSLGDVSAAPGGEFVLSMLRSGDSVNLASISALRFDCGFWSRLNISLGSGSFLPRKFIQTCDGALVLLLGNTIRALTVGNSIPDILSSLSGHAEIVDATAMPLSLHSVRDGFDLTALK